jgi:predicted metal-dependent phosphoesterase TrpH
MKCDMHVHTRYSGLCDIPVASRFCRESYSDPEALYARLKRLGMDLVTITDHDSIDAAESLRHLPDFFLSEEVSVRMPGGTRAHVGVYDIKERQHIELQRRRDDLPSFLSYLKEQKLLFSINHVFSGLTGPRSVSDWEWFEFHFPAIEVLNGCMIARTNRHAGELARRWGKLGLGGSDAHTLAAAGSAYTEVHGVASKDDFLSGLWHGRATVQGESGGYWKLTRDILLICTGMMRERPWTRILSPLLAGVPAAMLVNYCMEAVFAHRWHRQLVPGKAVSVRGSATLSAGEA